MHMQLLSFSSHQPVGSIEFIPNQTNAKKSLLLIRSSLDLACWEEQFLEKFSDLDLIRLLDTSRI